MSIAGQLALTLYVGAAIADASGDQKRLLNTTLPPLLRRAKQEAHDNAQYKLVVESMILTIGRIMGSEWRPRGEAADYINQLLKER